MFFSRETKTPLKQPVTSQHIPVELFGFVSFRIPCSFSPFENAVMLFLWKRRCHVYEWGFVPVRVPCISVKEPGFALRLPTGPVFSSVKYTPPGVGLHGDLDSRVGEWERNPASP